MSDPNEGYPLSDQETTDLAIFNSEVARGLVHRPSYAARMAELQGRYDQWINDRNEASGYNDWARERNTRVSTVAPYVTGGAHVSQAELDQVARELGGS